MGERSTEVLFATAPRKALVIMKLFLFANEPDLVRQAISAGIDAVVVDWENRGKKDRQQSGDFEINFDTPATAHMASSLGATLCVRVNRLGNYTESEIATALDCGAKIIMAPMCQGICDVEAFASAISDRAELFVQIETTELVDKIDELANIPWDYAHIGLNDLKLSRGAATIWDAVEDGTTESICRKLKGRRFGFGGLTVVDGGVPVPARLIIAEMVRLGCSIGVLRRSFKADIKGRSIVSEVAAIRHFIGNAQARTEGEIINDSTDLILAIRRASDHIQ